MRRNTVTLLKYVLAAAIFVVTGPMALKFLFGRNGVDRTPADTDRGMPQAPHEAQRGQRDLVKEMRQNDQPVDGPVNHQQELVDDGDPMEKIDWHNYRQIAEEEQRKGPGEQGQAVILSPEEEGKKDDLYRVNGFNAFASDKISLDRALKDIRHADCKAKKYVRKLPTASVVVPFHNEHWTTLLRTVHSVINRSPKHLLHEVILADDFSNKEFLGEQLEEYVKSHFSNVKVVRAKQREGLIRTRLLGARAATGDVLIFLDSHVEANTNWLPPLLEPIALNRKTVVCPFIDVIDFETFAYRAQDEGARGAFDWEFFYKRLPLQPEDLKHPSEPFKSPVMAGGLFAMDRLFFWDLGGYDPGLDIWGGEQYELSFKIWQCHGEMVDAPCSRVGHIYRKFAPFPNPGVGDFVGRNYKRVAEVWMDEYKEYLYMRRTNYRGIDPGDLSAQLAIRKKHKCKPFKWFMKEVAFDLPNYYPPVEPKPFASGELRHKESNLCIDTRFKGANEGFGLEDCIKDGAGGGEQNFEMTWHKDIRPSKRAVCFDVSQSIPKAPVILFSCHGMKGNQWWKYNVNTNQLKHMISNQCLDADSERKDIYMNPCNPSSSSQKWQFGHLNETAVRIEWSRD